MKTLPSYFLSVLLLTGFICLLPVKSRGQGSDTAFRKEFDQFYQQINQEFDAFRQHNDSVFLRFLKDSWKEFEGSPHPVPQPPKPTAQPVYKGSALPRETDNDQSPDEPDQEAVPGTGHPVPEKESMGSYPASGFFSFYGTPIALPGISGRFPALRGVSRQFISDYYSSACRSTEFLGVVKSLKEESVRYNLNDWGLASMLFEASKAWYSNVNDQVLFTWAGLLKNGYNAKVGYSNDRVYLLLPADIMLYTVSYSVNNRDYYLVEPGVLVKVPDRLFIHEADYPEGSTEFSFRLTEMPRLKYLGEKRALKGSRPLTISLNKNLLDFFSNYPPCDLQVYFTTPLSESTCRQLDVYFDEMLKGRSDEQRLAFLLDYVQHAVPYLTDKEQFGRERYLFPEETLYYAGADCEDRSALLAALIRRYTSLDFLVLGFPAHVTLAVNLNTCNGDDFLNYKSRRFYHADPTYLGAECGMAMPEVKSKPAEIIYSNF